MVRISSWITRHLWNFNTRLLISKKSRWFWTGNGGCVEHRNSDRSVSVHTWHRCQLGGHVAFRADLLPSGCGKMEPPKFPKKRVVFVFCPTSLLKVWVVASKHIKIGAVSNAAMSTAGWGDTMAWRTFRTQKKVKLNMNCKLKINTCLLLSWSSHNKHVYPGYFIGQYFTCIKATQIKKFHNLLSETCWGSADWGKMGRRCAEPGANVPAFLRLQGNKNTKEPSHMYAQSVWAVASAPRLHKEIEIFTWLWLTSMWFLSLVGNYYYYYWMF